MRHLAIAAAAIAGISGSAMAQEASPEPARTQIMVLGTYHFGNPGLDVANVEADDVLAPERQKEIAALTDALAQWKPTKILIEAQPDTPDLHMRSYRREAEKRIAEEPDEHFQIGYRLAKQLGHSDVFGFDERPGEGEPDYFPMGSVQQWAEANGQMPKFAAHIERIQSIVAEISADDGECSISRNLIDHNNPDMLSEAHGVLYYGMLGFGDADQQPGAELNAYWYMRNAKMFGKVQLISEPGDRVLVIVGSGHKYWLDHFAEIAEGYDLVSPLPFLEQADDGRCD